MTFDYLIVGAGFSGAILAERLASQKGKRVVVVDRRNHIGGNCYDKYNSDGILVHAYGPHYFRTNSDKVIDYLSKFTEWIAADYKILSWTHGRYWNFPINLNTFEQFVGKQMNEDEMIGMLDNIREKIEFPSNSEELMVSKIGRELYEMFYKGYTKKQWGIDASQLDASVCGRIPIRTNRDNRYFSEKFQALPKKGYTELFRNMLFNPRIEVLLNTDYREARENIQFGHLIYTGPVDEYFDYRHGHLPYRSLRFEEQTIPCKYYLPAVQVNYPNEHGFTRIVEVKHITGQSSDLTTIVREYPENHLLGREPYYPIPTESAKLLYKKYEEDVEREANVTFLGRLATYKYLNMDQVVALALSAFEKLCFQ